MAAPTLVEVARELYLLPPAEFVAARDARRAELRSTHRELADEVGRLRRASPAAWLVTLLAHERPEIVTEMTALGDELRRALDEADREALGRLTEERRGALTSAADAARELAEAAGARVSRAALDDATETLQAAMGDPAAAAAVRSGLLVRPLEPAGFDRVELDGALAVEVEELADVAPAAPPRPRLRPVKDPDAELARARREAEDELAAAEASLAEARAAVDALETERAQLERRRRELETELADLESELVRTRAGLATANRELRAVDAEAGRAERALDAAERRRGDAAARRERFR